MIKIKVTALPWFAGQAICAAAGLSVEFAWASSFTVLILALTKNIDWY